MNSRDLVYLIRAKLKYAWLRRKPYAPCDFAYQHHIYLPEWQLVYFFVPKVACTSIKSVLMELLRSPSAVSPHAFDFPKLDRRTFIDDVTRMDSFAVVRDPLSRLISGYKSMVLRAAHDRQYLHGVYRPLLKYGGFRHAMDFEDFCLRVVEIPDRWADPHFRSQTTCFTHAEANCLPHRIMRFDSIATEIPAYLQQVTGQRIDLPKQNQTDDVSFDSTLSNECRQLLRSRFDSDFRLYEELAMPLRKSA